MVRERGLRLGAWPIAGRVGAVIADFGLPDGLNDDALEDLRWLLGERGTRDLLDQPILAG